MGYVAVKNMMFPQPMSAAVNPPASLSSAMTASAHKFAWIGPVQTPDRGSKNIQTVGFLPGTVTSAGGSTVRVSLQDVDATTGFPMRPDGTPDQTVSFNVNTMTSNTWFTTGNLSATRTVSHGTMLAVVVEFTTYNGADALNLNNLSAGSTIYGNWGCSLFTASWAQAAGLPNIILGFDDGTFGTLSAFAFPYASLTTDNVNTGSTPDEVALAFSVPAPCKIDGAWFLSANSATGRDYSVVLYNGTSSMVATIVDADQAQGSTGSMKTVSFAEQTLTPGNTYYLSILPATAGNNTVYSFTVNTADHLTAHAGGTAFTYATRKSLGAWTATATKRFFGGIILSATPDGAGGSGVIGG